jgi:hypothetical protein
MANARKKCLRSVTLKRVVKEENCDQNHTQIKIKT